MDSLMHPTRLIRNSAGLFKGFRRGLLALRGPDRVRFLHNLVSHDIKGLTPGQARPACLLDRHGKIQASFLAHAWDQELILEMDPADLSKARSLLDTYRISESVQFEDWTDRYRILPLIGPSARQILQRAFSETSLPSGSLTDCEGPPGSALHRIGRWDLLRTPGYHLWTEPEAGDRIGDQLLKAGKPEGLLTAGRSEFEILRIEAGVPWPGAEIDETVILNELGTEEMVSFTKGCFVGQEIVARIKYRAHPPRLLTGFEIEGREVPPPRSAIEQESKQVGEITSACFSPTLNRVIALGFLQYGASPESLRVKLSSGSPRATVAPLPFIPTASG